MVNIELVKHLNHRFENLRTFKRPHISQILNDKHHLEYFKEFLKLNERRLLTLTKGKNPSR